MTPANLPAVGVCVDYLDLGTIVRTGELTFRAVARSGRSYFAHNKTRADASMRTAENFLRGQAGLPKLGRLCSGCGRELGLKTTCYAPDCARARVRKTPLPSPSELAFLALAPAEVLQRAQQAASARPMPAGKAAQPATKGDYSMADATHLRAARLAADALIRRRFGVPIPAGYDGYLRDLVAGR